MQIYADKLARHITEQLDPVFLIAGDDILLQSEACDLIRNAATKQGFSEREIFSVDTSFDWMSWLDSCNAMSLFADRKLVELRLSSSKIGTSGSEAISRYLKNPAPETVLLISSPRIEGKPAWVKAATSQGVYVPIYPLDSKQLPAWLVRRAKSVGLQLSRDAAALLAERVEGNLMAAAQELEKLALLLPKDSPVEVETIGRAVADNARFSAFNMLDRAIDGDAIAACRALRHLKDEGNEPPAIIGAIAHQLRTLIELKDYQAQGKLNAGLQALRVLKKRQAAVTNILAKRPLADLHDFIRLASTADKLSKSVDKATAWEVMEMILLGLAGKPLPTQQFYLDT